MLDLDGVVWLTGRPIPGVDEAVATLRGAGVRVLFATNNSAPTRAELHGDWPRLRHHRAGRRPARVGRRRRRPCSRPGSTALVLGEDGVVEALAGRGVTVVPEGPADAVVVGWTRTFTYDDLARAAAAVRAGARLVGTNEDATSRRPTGSSPAPGPSWPPWPRRPRPTPEVAGKPHRPTADAIRARVPAGELRVVVGDRPSTDGALAAQLGHPVRPGALRGDPPPGRRLPDGAPTRRPSAAGPGRPGPRSRLNVPTGLRQVLALS